MKVSEKVQRVIEGEQISPAELIYMVKHAAITSRMGCNRRYHHWIFRVDGEAISDMQYADPTLVVGKGPTVVQEDHLVCQGAGCRQCGWSGSVYRRIVDRTANYLDKRRATA